MFAIPQVIGPDLAQRLSATHRRASTAYLAAGRLALEELLRQPDAVAALPLTRKRHGYARTLLFGEGKLSLWAMSWDVGAKTPIHDHHCSCCFGLLSGILKEIEFRTIDDATAVATAQTVRRPETSYAWSPRDRTCTRSSTKVRPRRSRCTSTVMTIRLMQRRSIANTGSRVTEPAVRSRTPRASGFSGGASEAPAAPCRLCDVRSSSARQLYAPELCRQSN